MFKTKIDKIDTPFKTKPSGHTLLGCTSPLKQYKGVPPGTKIPHLTSVIYLQCLCGVFGLFRAIPLSFRLSVVLSLFNLHWGSLGDDGLGGPLSRNLP